MYQHNPPGGPAGAGADDDRDCLPARLRGDHAGYDFAVPMLHAGTPAPPAGERRAFGDAVHPATAKAYLGLLQRLARETARPAPGRRAPPWFLALPWLHSDQSALIAALDAHVRARLPAHMEPASAEALHLLLRPQAIRRLARSFARESAGAIDIELRRLSEVAALPVRPDRSLPVGKCIYPRLPLDPQDPARERELLEWADEDASVQAFCRLDGRHAFPDLPYPDEQDRRTLCRPDYLVRTSVATYLVDLRERPAAAARQHIAMHWCDLVNALPPSLRGERHWLYAPLAREPFADWRRYRARLGELLAVARFRAGRDALPRDTPAG